MCALLGPEFVEQVTHDILPLLQTPSFVPFPFHVPGDNSGFRSDREALLGSLNMYYSAAAEHLPSGVAQRADEAREASSSSDI